MQERDGRRCGAVSCRRHITRTRMLAPTSRITATLPRAIRSRPQARPISITGAPIGAKTRARAKISMLPQDPPTPQTHPSQKEGTLPNSHRSSLDRHNALRCVPAQVAECMHRGRSNVPVVGGRLLRFTPSDWTSEAGGRPPTLRTVSTRQGGFMRRVAHARGACSLGSTKRPIDQRPPPAPRDSPGSAYPGKRLPRQEPALSRVYARAPPQRRGNGRHERHRDPLLSLSGSVARETSVALSARPPGGGEGMGEGGGENAHAPPRRGGAIRQRHWKRGHKTWTAHFGVYSLGDLPGSGSNRAIGI